MQSSTDISTYILSRIFEVCFGLYFAFDGITYNNTSYANTDWIAEVDWAMGDSSINVGKNIPRADFLTTISTVIALLVEKV